MRIIFRTNLDVQEQWPEWEHDCPLPTKGDFVRSKRGLTLEVCNRYFSQGEVEIELHIPRHLDQSIREFEEWYEQFVAKRRYE